MFATYNAVFSKDKIQRQQTQSHIIDHTNLTSNHISLYNRRLLFSNRHYITTMYVYTLIDDTSIAFLFSCFQLLKCYSVFAQTVYFEGKHPRLIFNNI